MGICNLSTFLRLLILIFVVGVCVLGVLIDVVVFVVALVDVGGLLVFGVVLGLLVFGVVLGLLVFGVVLVVLGGLLGGLLVFLTKGL